MSFSDLKKQSSLGSLTAKLVKEVEKLNSTGSTADERLWKPEVDKSGNGYAVIRFLPAPEGEELPFVKVYSHAFKGSGGWFIDNCLTTLGQTCPVCQANSLLWNSGSDSNKEIARNRKRKLSYYSNIYVVKDPANSENEGKVFLFKYGKKIFDKIQAAMKPELDSEAYEFEDEDPINPFDFWQGANFKLKIKNVAGYWNYDSSEFMKPSPLLEDDSAMEALWNREYSIAEFLNPSNFKTAEQIQTRLNKALGLAGSQTPVDESLEDEEEFRYTESKSLAKPSTDDEDDALSYFQRLAEDD
jgi:hypothetical protein